MQFTEGQTYVHDKDRSGRPSLVMPELMESVLQAVLQNQLFKISELWSILPVLINARISQMMGDNISAAIFT